MGHRRARRRTWRTPSETDLSGYLRRPRVRRRRDLDVVDPDPADVAGFAAYLDRYRAGLAVERAAVEAL